MCCRHHHQQHHQGNPQIYVSSLNSCDGEQATRTGEKSREILDLTLTTRCGQAWRNVDISYPWRRRQASSTRISLTFGNCIFSAPHFCTLPPFQDLTRLDHKMASAGDAMDVEPLATPSPPNLPSPGKDIGEILEDGDIWV